MKTLYIHLGCADNVKHIDLCNDPNWQGILVDVSPASIIDMILKYKHNKNLLVVHAAVASKNGFSQVQAHESIDKVDEKMMLVHAEKHNDWFQKYETERDENDYFEKLFYTPTVTLDELVSCFVPSTSKIGLLAVDIQGAEVEVFESYSWQKKPCQIEIEPHSDEAQKIIWATLTHQGYRMVNVNDVDDYPRVNYLWELNKDVDTISN